MSAAAVYDTDDRVPRFDVVTRVVHWATAALMLILLATGTVLYVPQLSAVIGRRDLLKTIHVMSGLLLVVPIIVAVVAGPFGRGLRRDLVELGRWDGSDTAWLRRRTRRDPDGKFNGGQKLLTALFGGAIAMQLLTGAIMNWNRPFPDDWRTGATFVHDWAYIAIVALTIGHIFKALDEPELRHAMVHGSVSKTWARRARPGWSATPPPDDRAAP